MNPVVTIALLTLREAVRRRLVAACVAITIGLVALSAWDSIVSATTPASPRERSA